MLFSDVILKRNSCRNFQNKKIEPIILEQLVEMARTAPSAVNGQPWFLHVVSNEETLAFIKQACTSMKMNLFILKAPTLIVIEETQDNILSSTIGKIKEMPFSSIDIGIITAFITLAATSLDLGSCILGWFDKDKIKKALNLNKTAKIRLVIAVGYPTNEQIKPKKRKDTKKMSAFYE
jgi:nitroreductase